MNLFVILFILDFGSASILPVYLEILKSKNIEDAVLFHCSANYGVLLNQKIFNENNIRVASFKTQNFTHLPNIGNFKIAFMMDTKCGRWEIILSTVDERFFRGPCTWLVYTDDLRGTVDALSKYPVDINSDFIIITKDDFKKVYNIFEVFNKGFYTNGSFVISEIGYLDAALHMTPSRRVDLTGVVLKSVVVVVDPIVNETFEQYLDHTTPGVLVDSLHKLKFYTLIKYLRNIYNFSIQLRRTNSWGYLRNGSFDGLVGSLQRREADIGGTPIFFRSDRSRYIDYVTPTWQSRYQHNLKIYEILVSETYSCGVFTLRPCFILRHPKYPGGFYTIYTRPLTSVVWYWIICTLSLAGLVVCIMLKISIIKTTGDDQDSSSSMAFIFIFSAISQQGTTLNRGSISIKIVIFVTFVFTLTLYQYYNATVVSTLLREPPKSIRNLKDLLKSSLKAGVEDVLYNKDYFRRTTDPVALELYHKKIVTNTEYNFFKPDYGMQLVKAGGFAYHIDSISAYRIMRKTFSEREICDAHEIYLYPPQNMAAALQKNSPYREHVVVGIRKIYESGLMYRLKSVWDEPKPPCVHTPDSSIFSISLREFSSALIMLALGMLISVVILLVENFVYKFNVKPYEFRH